VKESDEKEFRLRIKYYAGEPLVLDLFQDRFGISYFKEQNKELDSEIP